MSPSASGTKRTTGGTKKLTREQKYDKEFQETFLKSQLNGSDENKDLTDVKLICNGGFILAHGLLLQTLSPLFEAVFKSQGDSYVYKREIILPDFTLVEMQKVMQLVYSGSVYVETEDESKSLKKILAELQIENDSLGNIVTKKTTKKADDNKLEIRITKGGDRKNRLKSEDDKDSVKFSVDLSSCEENPNTRTVQTRSGKQVKLKRRYNDSDYEPTTDEESVEKAPETQKSSSKSSVTKVVDVSNSTPKADSNTKSGVAAVISSRSSKNRKNDDSDNEGEWREPNYNDKKWFDKEARKCQFCKKDHDNPALASMCITGHQRLRCYFCFRVCKNTEKLFEHFKNQHKQAGRENCLLCPYCEQTIPFKSVSCHVISLHLSDMRAGAKIDDKNKTPAPNTPAKPAITIPYRPRGGPGRPPTFQPKPTSSSATELKKKPDAPSTSKSAKNDSNGKIAGPTTKKPRISVMERTIDMDKDSDGLYRVPNLDVTIRRQGIDGRIWVWRIQKDNPPATE